jgi:hypothetical protein
VKDHEYFLLAAVFSTVLAAATSGIASYQLGYVYGSKEGRAFERGLRDNEWTRWSMMRDIVQKPVCTLSGPEPTK